MWPMVEFDPVGTIAFFRERHRVESRITGCVLIAVPADRLSYTPHPASSTAGAVAWTIVRCLRACNRLTEIDTAEISLDVAPDHATLVESFDAESRMLAERLAVLSQQDWTTDRSVTSLGRVLLNHSMGQIFWLFHVDAIHHRGQISTFLRGFGAKVPSIYGPSGDSQR